MISTVLFDNVSEVIHDRVPVQKVEPMTDKDYYVRGCTALSGCYWRSNSSHWEYP